MKAIILARVSNASQEEGQSIPAQIRRLTEYALRKNLIIEHTYQITESSSITTRKKFNEILAFVRKSKEPFALITDTVDRLQRSFRDTPLLDELRKQGKIELHFLRESLILNKQSNSAQLQQWDVGVLFASSYVRQLGDNVKRSQEECIRNGQWISKAPFGYKNISLQSGQKTIIINELEAPFVVKVFEAYAQDNISFQTLAATMKPIFPPTARGKTVTARTIELILKNPFHMGLMNIKEQLHPHKYETLISEDLFNCVQNIMHKKNKSPIQHAGKPILFRGLITCKNCAGAVTGDIKKKKYVYYSCHNSKRICKKKWVKEETIVKEVLRNFDAIQLTHHQIEEIMNDLQTEDIIAQRTIENKLRILNEKLNLTQERISKLIDMHIDGKIDAETYYGKLEEYKREQQKLLLEIKSYDTDHKVELIVAQQILEMTQDAKECFMSSKFDEKQQLLKLFCSNLFLNNEKLDVELRMPFNLMPQMQDQTVWRS
ncbi:recombinase family protein [Candidatus Babeliales bacterium]|nr:recombinase family protein [Candidatus Babeliales bacterium]MBP9843531.1 recombinase family protein [Candidatus Babeliales bacterium]